MALSRFPGRFLEEIDVIDWVRHNRALEVQNIIEVERAWSEVRRRKGKPTPELALAISEHEAILRKAMGLPPAGEEMEEE